MRKSPENKEGEESGQDDLENESEKVKVVGFKGAPKRQKKKEELPKGCESKRQKNKNAYKEITDIPVMGKKCLSMRDALDGLTSSKRWLGANIYIAPPDDGNCSDEDSADDDNPQLHNLSRKQLMANCELQVTCYDDDDVKVMQDADHLADIDGDEHSHTDPVTSLNCWMADVDEDTQQDLRATIENVELSENSTLQALDAENSSWTHVRTFELFFDGELLELIVGMTNQYALEKAAVAWIPLHKQTLRSFITILVLSGCATSTGEESHAQKPLLCHSSISPLLW